MDKISIIIPVYNVEPYIRKCLDSIINQTYTNLEILLIDDGSTDNSGQICDEYAEQDKRIIVFHTVNRGVSSAKNLGLKSATGRYIGFVDSDDWTEPDMYETLYKAMNKENASISIVNYFKDTDTESTPMANKNPIPKSVISTRYMLLYPLQRDYYMGFCGYLCNKLFAADIFRHYNLRFDESICYGEDVLLYTEAVLAANCTGIYCERPLYHYYQRDSAVTKSKSVSVKSDILTVYKRVEKLLDNNGYSDDSFWARGFYCHHASVIAEIALKNNDRKTLSFMQDEIKRHLGDYMKTNEAFPEKFERIHNLLDKRRKY